MKYGVDISFWKNFPDWSRAKESGVEFAIFGVTELNGIDASFEHNYKGCTENGIIKGAYKYSYAHNADESRKEAQDVINALQGRPLDLPIFLDLEWEWQEDNLSKNTIWQIIQAFKEIVEEAGYEFGIYCNLNWYWNLLPEEAKQYNFWIAYPPNEDVGEYNAGLRPNIPNLICWQYSWNGYVPGIGNEIDLDVWFNDGEIEDVKQPSKIQQIQFPVISYGEKGKIVQLLQILLNSQGSHIEVDGDFGPMTSRAVSDYQEENNLEVDGIVGNETWYSLLKNF